MPEEINIPEEQTPVAVIEVPKPKAALPSPTDLRKLRQTLNTQEQTIHQLEEFCKELKAQLEAKDQQIEKLNSDLQIARALKTVVVSNVAAQLEVLHKSLQLEVRRD